MDNSQYLYLLYLVCGIYGLCQGLSIPDRSSSDSHPHNMIEYLFPNGSKK